MYTFTQLNNQCGTFDALRAMKICSMHEHITGGRCLSHAVGVVMMVLKCHSNKHAGVTLQVAYDYVDDSLTAPGLSSGLSVPYEMVAMVSHVRYSPPAPVQSPSQLLDEC